MVNFARNISDAALETRIRALVEKAASTSRIERDEILTLLRANTGQAECLFAAADSVRRNAVGDSIVLLGLIEFSNYCRRNCFYCGIRAENKDLERYSIPPDEILRICEKMVDLGVYHALLQSGEDPNYTCDELCNLIEKIKSSFSVKITLAIGERKPKDCEALKQAGADGFLLKHHTADSSLYAKLHPGMSFFDRLHCLSHVKELGFEFGGGSMVGLPGQTLHSLADDTILLRSLNVSIATIGPFIAAHGTPLAFEGETWRLRQTPLLSVSNKKETVVEFVLKLIALTRLLLPRVQLVSNTALASLLPRGREMGLLAGANVLLPNFTPTKCKELFGVFDDRICTRETPEEAMASIKILAEKLGRKL